MGCVLCGGGAVQEAVVQYEQYEQEVRELQGLIEEAHGVIQDRPFSTNSIQELQAQIIHHEVHTHTLSHAFTLLHGFTWSHMHTFTHAHICALV